MNCRRLVKLATACVFALGVTVCAQSTAVDEPSDQFFKGYLLKSEAEKMENTGNLAGALSLYRQMQQVFDGVSRAFPTWQPDMLNNRRHITMQAISRVEAKLANPSLQTPAANAGGVSAAAPGATLMPQSSAIPAPGVLAPGFSTGSGLPSLGEVLAQWDQANQKRILELQAQNNQMQNDLGKWQQWYQWASSEITTARADKDALGQKAANLEKAIKDMEKAVASGTATSGQLEALTQEKLKLEVDYRKAAQRLTAAETASKEASQKLADASIRVSSLEEERNKLMTERDEAVKGRDAAVQERNAAKAESLGLKAEVEDLRKRSAGGDMKKLMAQYDHVRAELEDAQKQIITLKGEVNRKDQELTQLRGQITTLQGELATLRQQSGEYQTQVAELTMQLKQLQEAKPGVIDPQLAQENATLREVIMRQLRSQYRQQQAKDLVIAALQKTENVSQDLLKQVEELKNGRMVLTPAEEKLFSDPQVKDLLGQSSMQGTLIASAGGTPDKATPASEKTVAQSPAAASADALLAKANEAFSQKKFADAAALYEDALRADPKNTTAMVGLGYARQREGKLSQAEAALKKCLAVDPENEPAAFHLGVTLFREQHWADAMSSFEKSVAKRPQNASARHYMGIIATKLNLMERAEREFKTALAIDPNYGEAHFNLAVLYVTWDPPQWAKAKASYDEALKKGVSPDASLEKLLKNNVKSVSVR